MGDMADDAEIRADLEADEPDFDDRDPEWESLQASEPADLAWAEEQELEVETNRDTDIKGEPMDVEFRDVTPSELAAMWSPVEQGQYDDDPNPYHGNDADDQGLIGGDSDLFGEQ